MDLTYLVHTMNMKALLALVGFALAGLASGQTFVPIDVESELNGLEIKVNSNNIGAQVILSLQNEEDFPVACRALFNNGPQTPVERRLILKAEERSQMTAPLFRSVTRVRVHLVCEREQAEADGEQPAVETSAKE